LHGGTWLDRFPRVTAHPGALSPPQLAENPTESTWNGDSTDGWEPLRSFLSETPTDFSSPGGSRSLPGRNLQAPPRVLLAHADETRREGLAWELGAQGCTVIEVEDGKELLDYLASGGAFAPLPRPDVIVAELEMPGCSGLDAARALRAQGDHTPIVFINVSNAPSAAIAAARLAETKLLDGDIEGGVLRAAVETALREQTP
jgi:CheY-like chemotaxis protein